MLWDVYEWEAPTRTATWIGRVRGAHWAFAMRGAAKRWPKLAKASFPAYPVGRLILRPKDDVRGMPCTIKGRPS